MYRLVTLNGVHVNQHFVKMVLIYHMNAIIVFNYGY